MKTQIAQAAQKVSLINQSKVSQIKVPGNLPERKFRAGAISATIWLNKGLNSNGEESDYRTISLERAYNKDGEWQSTNSLRLNDLPKATVVLQKAYEFLVLSA